MKLKDLGAGSFQIDVKTKRWFTAAAANQAADSTVLTITLDRKCFTRTATQKTD